MYTAGQLITDKDKIFRVTQVFGDPSDGTVMLAFAPHVEPKAKRQVRPSRVMPTAGEAHLVIPSMTAAGQEEASRHQAVLQVAGVVSLLEAGDNLKLRCERAACNREVSHTGEDIHDAQLSLITAGMVDGKLVKVRKPVRPFLALWWRRFLWQLSDRVLVKLENWHTQLRRWRYVQKQKPLSNEA